MVETFERNIVFLSHKRIKRNRMDVTDDLIGIIFPCSGCRGWLDTATPFGVLSESSRTPRTTLSAAAPQPVFVTLTIDAFNARGHLCCLVHLDHTRVVASRSIMSAWPSVP
jgi:hypothetical protein